VTKGFLMRSEKNTSVLKSKHFSALQQVLQKSYRFHYLTKTKTICNSFYCFSSQQLKWKKPAEQVPAASGYPTAQQNPQAIKNREASTHLHVFPQQGSFCG